MNFYIDDYQIRTDSHELLYKNTPKKIEPRVFKLLTFMLENPCRVLSRDELVNAVWKARVISDSAISTTINAARCAIGDTGSKQKYIKTVSGSGYRFIAKFSCQENTVQKTQSKHTLTIPTTPFVEHKQPSLEPLEFPDKPSIAVMNFVDRGASEKGTLFARGITIEINASLARLYHLFVIARASSAHVSKMQLLPKEIGQCLGVRYLVYGNLEYLPQRVRLTMSVINAQENTEIWSEHFDRPLDDIFQVQDEITRSIIIAVDFALEQAEIERALLVSPNNLSAWENYHRGLWHMYQPTNKNTVLAKQFFQKSLALDPQFSRAYAGLSCIYTSHILLNTTPEKDKTNIIQAFDYAQRSIDCNKREDTGYFALARALWLSKEDKQAIEACEQGLHFNANNAQCYDLKGIVSAYTGQHTQALQCFNSARQLSPFDPIKFATQTALAISLVHQKKYNEAIDLILSAVNNPRAYFITYAVAAACFQLTNRPRQAQQYVAKVLELHPTYSIESHLQIISHSNKATKALLINAMLSAGLPMTSSNAHLK
jgi:TolB-like protein